LIRNGLLSAFVALALISASGSFREAISQGQADEPTVVPWGETVRPGGNLPGDPVIQLVKVADGFSEPVNLAAPADGSDRLFVADRYGVIRIVDAHGSLLEDPFLDITSSVQWGHQEQGLLGLAFHPDYARDGRFFVSFTEIDTNADLQVMEFTVSADDPNKADPASGRLILAVDKPFRAHNGGTIRFGPDGYLYVGIGDGGLAGDPLGYAQNFSSPLGKILRIDVDANESQAYEIPPDNPFATTDQVENSIVEVSEQPSDREERPRRRARAQAADAPPAPVGIPELWASGFRNPWQFSFDPMTDDLYITDVGELAIEEINFQPAGRPGGQNYGWNWLEGSRCFPSGGTECAPPPDVVGPVAEYEHEHGGCAIIGIGVYRGTEFPELDGIYFSADRCTGKVWGLARDARGNWQFQELLDSDLLFTGAGTSESGVLYVAATRCTCDDPEEFRLGSIWKIIPANRVTNGVETAPLSTPEISEATPATAEYGVATPIISQPA
jgi:glucose/arabinose dehydrogenase